MRDAEPVARLAGGDDAVGRAARALGVRPLGIEPEPESHANRIRQRAQQRDGAVDASAHRDGGAGRRRHRAENRPERVRERVDRQCLAADRRRLEQRQSREVALEPRRVGLDDRVAVDAEPHRGPLTAATGVSEALDHWWGPS